MQNREALKEEFLQYPLAVDYKKDGVTITDFDYHKEDLAEIADWWLKKIASRDEELVKKIEGMMEKEPPNAGYTAVEASMYSYAKGLNSALIYVIKLIKG